MTREELKVTLASKLAETNVATIECDKVTIEIREFGTYAWITLTEPSEYWEGEDDTIYWTISHDTNRNLPVNISGRLLPQIQMLTEIACRNYSSEMGSGTTLASMVLLEVYARLIK